MMNPRRRQDLQGFTLVELLVALALAAVISVSIMFISTQARSAYEATVTKVDVYNRFRYALSNIESDFEQMIGTGELEFYVDGRGRGILNSHWDPIEELPDERDAEGLGVVDGGTYNDYDEFPYILQRRYRSQEPGQSSPKLHDAYEAYFRTLTYVDGGTRVANVEYVLADPEADRVNGKPQLSTGVVPKEKAAGLSLFKIIRYQDINEEIILKQTQVPVKRKIVEVATNVTDFRVEYTVENRNSTRRDLQPGFRTPEQDYENPSELVTRPLRIEQAGNVAYKKQFGYGSVKLDVSFPRAVAYRAKGGDQDGLGRNDPEVAPMRFGFQKVDEISFAQLTPGDQIYVFTESSRAAIGGAQNTTGNVSLLIGIRSGDYTVKANLKGLLEFEEDVDSASWSAENISNLYYKAAYLPSAVRITLRVVDDRGENPKTMQREVWLRRRSR